MMIRTLSVLLAIALASFAFYAVKMEGVFDPSESPYPSEETPLVLQQWGITWNRDFNETLNGEIAVWAYANITLSLTEYMENGSSKRTNALSVEAFMDVSGFSAPATLEEAEDMANAQHYAYFDGGVEVDVLTVYFVSDTTDPEVFNRGDTISFVHLIYLDGELSSAGFEEEVVYAIELTCEVAGQTAQERYGIAVHDGTLYSWIDHGPVDDPLS
ncbi:TPA: hypothetical protein HA259_06885 [Thermoplasmata archaeon]|nr:hypothetical protein [Thermoplasmata archaeon]